MKESQKNCHKIARANLMPLRGAKAVVLFDREGKKIKRFDSAKACANHLGIAPQSVTACATGKNQSVCEKAFTVKYAKDLPKSRPAPTSKMEIKKK
mgnify:FL=1